MVIFVVSKIRNAAAAAAAAARRWILFSVVISLGLLSENHRQCTFKFDSATTKFWNICTKHLTKQCQKQSRALVIFVGTL